jgi:hypothetical protein
MLQTKEKRTKEMKRQQYFRVDFEYAEQRDDARYSKIMCAEDIYELMHNLTILHKVCADEVVYIDHADMNEILEFQFDEFVEHLNATLSRLKSIESCDNDYSVSWEENDVQSVLMCSFSTMFNLKCNDQRELTVSRDELYSAFAEDKYAMKNLLDSFNSIMDRYHVITNPEFTFKVHLI